MSGVYFCLGRLAGSGFGYIRGDRPGRGAAGFQGLLLKEGVDMQVLLWKGRTGAVLVDTRQMQILLIRESGGEQQASRVSFGKERGQQLSRFSFGRIIGGAEAKQVILWEWGEGQQESNWSTFGSCSRKPGPLFGPPCFQLKANEFRKQIHCRFASAHA